MLKSFPVYIKYSKPKVWWLLVFVGFAGAVIAINKFTLNNILLILLAVISVTFGSMGAEGLTNYIDRDMDSIMERTKSRPLPSGQISMRGALIFGYSMSIISVLLLLIFKLYISSLFMAFGIFDNVFIYSYLLKKISSYSIIYGGFSGAFPVLIGWYAITTHFSWLPWILFFLVMFWIPVHVWSLAYRYRDEYKKAGVPMYPVVHSDRSTAIAISTSAILLIVFSMVPYFAGIFDYIYAIIVALLSIPIIIFSYQFIKKPGKTSSLRLFIYTAPYLTLIFLMVLVIHIIQILNYIRI